MNHTKLLQRVMARLADLLDEDQFAEIERMVTNAGVTPPEWEKEKPAVNDFAHWLNERRDQTVREVFHDVVQRYRAATEHAQPLTDEQIEALLVNWPEDGIAFFDFARAIEAAHGIASKK